MSTTVMEGPRSQPRNLPYTWSPRLFLSELLLKQWFEPVIPFTVMILLALYFSLTIKDYGTLGNALSLARLFAEFGFVALGMMLSLISGGIDLSVGAIFAVFSQRSSAKHESPRSNALSIRSHARGTSGVACHDGPPDSRHDGPPDSRHDRSARISPRGSA